MTAHHDTYSRRGAIFTGAFSLALVSVSGTILYLSAPERLACERSADGRAVCRLERRVAGVTIRQRDLGQVQGSKIEEARPPSRPIGADRNTHNWRPVYWLLIFTEAGWVETVQGSDPSIYIETHRQLLELMTGPAARGFEATLPGSPRPVPYALGVFALGAVIPPLWLLGWLFPSLRPGPRTGGASPSPAA